MVMNINLFNFNVLNVLDRRYYNNFSLVLGIRAHKNPANTLLAILYSKLYIFINWWERVLLAKRIGCVTGRKTSVENEFNFLGKAVICLFCDHIEIFSFL